MPNANESPQETLARIDREIRELLYRGKLSRLEFGMAFPDTARTDRGKNLKALLQARGFWRSVAGAESFPAE